MNSHLFGLPSKKTAAWDQCHQLAAVLMKACEGWRKSPYFFIPHMFRILWLHFVCATSPSPGRPHSLHGMSAYGKLLLIWTGGNQIKGRKLEADSVVSGESHDAGADTESAVPPTSIQPPQHCWVPPLGSMPGRAPAITPPKKCCKAEPQAGGS